MPGTVTVPTQQERGLGGPTPTSLTSPNYLRSDHRAAVPRQQDSEVQDLALSPPPINAFYPAAVDRRPERQSHRCHAASVLQNDQFFRVDQQDNQQQPLNGAHTGIATSPPYMLKGVRSAPMLSGDTSPRSLHEDTIQDDWTISPHIVNHFAIGDIGFYTSQTNNPLGNPKYYVPVPGSFGAGFSRFLLPNPRLLRPRQRPRQLHHWRGELRGGPDP